MRQRFAIIGAFCAHLALCGAAAAEVAAARYEGPTTRYPHGVLGDRVEYGALVITRGDGTAVRFELPDHMVFEDIEPRLWDVTGDGAPEVVTVEADQRLGARLAIWTADGRLATTPPIGTRFRWLAPIAAADLDGDGAIEIAYVDRPHLAKTLRIWRYTDGWLTEVAALPGVSNHKIGWPYLVGGLTSCAGQPALVLASGDWQRVVAVTFNGAVSARDLGAYSPAALSRALRNCR
ncbi:MAG: VCBS repeat-containing protein [Pseudomonadota bacterium]